MKKQYVLFLWVLVSCLCCSSISNAGVIVDTGEPSSSQSMPALDRTQWLAARFILDQAYTITDIYGYMVKVGPEASNAGSLTIAIYGGGEQIPNVSNESFYKSVITDALWAVQPSWRGLSALNVELQTGTYWVAFEVRASDSFSGVMPGNSPNPIGDEANLISAHLFPAVSWSEYDAVDLGIRIYGDPIATPEPATMLLLGGALVGLAAFRRRLQK